jgi:hypothetical protein
MNAVGNIQKKKIMTKQTYIQNKKGTSLENCMKLKYIAHINVCMKLDSVLNQTWRFLNFKKIV